MRLVFSFCLFLSTFELLSPSTFASFSSSFAFFFFSFRDSAMSYALSIFFVFVRVGSASLSVLEGGYGLGRCMM